MTMLDALVLGKGPAALALGSALAGRGVRTGIVGPAGPVRWTPRYAAWADELPEGLPPAAVGCRWPRATIVAGARRVVQREYVLLDNDALASSLAADCDGGGVRWIDGTAVSAQHRPEGSTVHLAGGGQARARVVIDATGGTGTLLRRPHGPEAGWQTAVGWTVEAEEVPLEPECALLMDWSPAEDDAGPPTFLYAFALGDGRWFLEETALVRRPAVGEELLEARLRRRTDAMRIRGLRVVAEERVRIGMGGTLPQPQRVVGFGAAAGMVHPATGYSVARSLAAAPGMAAALAEALDTGTPEEASRVGWEALWPREARRRHALHRYGMEALLEMDGEETRGFFDAFFRLPDPAWQGYLSGGLDTRGLMEAMARVYAAAPPGVRRRLRSGMAAADGLALARGMLGW